MGAHLVDRIAKATSRQFCPQRAAMLPCRWNWIFRCAHLLDTSEHSSAGDEGGQHETAASKLTQEKQRRGCRRRRAPLRPVPPVRGSHLRRLPARESTVPVDAQAAAAARGCQLRPADRRLGRQQHPASMARHQCPPPVFPRLQHPARPRMMAGQLSAHRCCPRRSR